MSALREDDVGLIGEYVLGLLDAAEEAAVEARLAAEPDLRALHSDWAEALIPMAGGRDVAPPRALKAAVEARLFPTRAPAASAPRGRGGRALGWLGLFAGPALAFAAAFVILRPAGFDPSLHVDLSAPSVGLEIAAGADEDTLRIIHLGGEAAPGRTFQLWLIAGDAAPVSLGLLPTSGQIDIPRPEGLAVGVIFAISDEPEGGSPTGAPTGAVLAAEPLFEI